MGKVRNFDEKSCKNRARVRKYRNWKKAKSLHENYIRRQVEIEADESVHIDDSIYNGIFDDSFVNERENSTDKATEIKDKLKFWCVNHRITAMAMCDLLLILRFAGLEFLPRDSRTLMGTPVNVPIHSLSNGKLWYNGIRKCLEHALDKISNDMSITLDWNFDGLPIAKSSNSQFWPILSNIRGEYII